MWLYVALIVAVLWILGFLGKIGGSAVHLLLAIAVVALIVHLVGGRRSGV